MRLGNDCDAMNIIISAPEEDATSYHYRRREYVTWEVHACKLFHHGNLWKFICCARPTLRLCANPDDMNAA